MSDENIKLEDKLIDIERIIRTRAPKANRWLPGFLKRRMVRLIRQKEINEITVKYNDNVGLQFVKDILNHLKVTVTFSGLENFDKSKKYVFAANHPLGGLDGLGLIQAVSDNVGISKAIINDLLLNIVNLRPVFEGVNVYKNNSKEHLKKIDDLYESEKQIIVFPSGMVSRKIKGKITDLVWKKSFLTKAVQHKRDVVPVFIDGKNSNFFYNFAKIRKFLGLKFNIELIYLPREFFGYRGKNIHIKFGKPIPYQKFDNTKKMDEWVLEIRNEVYNLSN